MKRPFPYSKNKAGFTLIEIVIVAALIALFSGLATFGIQRMLSNNKLKAVIGETRQIGTSLIFAQQDIGFYPAIGFMSFHRDFIDVRYAWDRLHTMDFTLSGTRGQVAYNRWKGPYFAASQTRNQLSARYKHIVTMRLPALQGLEQDLSWPADQWGIPYVLYLFRYNPQEDTWEFIQDVGDEPNFWAAVVSYGPDQVPGALNAGENKVGVWSQYALFTEIDFRNGIFGALRSTQYTPERADRYSLPAPQVGISDPGSDDIIYNID